MKSGCLAVHAPEVPKDLRSGHGAVGEHPDVEHRWSGCRLAAVRIYSNSSYLLTETATSGIKARRAR